MLQIVSAKGATVNITVEHEFYFLASEGSV